jgi:hypothetical protein
MAAGFTVKLGLHPVELGCRPVQRPAMLDQRRHHADQYEHRPEEAGARRRPDQRADHKRRQGAT